MDLERQENKGVHAGIVEAVGQKAARDISAIEVDSVVDRSQLIRVGYLLVAIFASFAAYKIMSPRDPLQTVARVLAPWADIARPSRVRILDVTPGSKEVYFGETVEVAVSLRGTHEGDEVRIIYSTADGQVVDRAVVMKGGVGLLDYRGKLPASDSPSGENGSGVQQDLIYRIEAGDAVSNSYRLSVVTAPTILVKRVTYAYPDYMKKETRSVDNQGDLTGPEGARVTIEAVANLALESAVLEMDPVNGKPTATIAMSCEGSNARGALVLARNADGQPKYRTYQIRLVTKDAQRNDKPILHAIEVMPDLPPEATILSPEELVHEIPLDGELPVEVRAVDPDFGLTHVGIVGERGSKESELVTLLAKDAPQVPQYTGRAVLKPAKLGMKVGEELAFYATASDNRHDIESGSLRPSTGRSAGHILRVIAPEGASPMDDPSQEKTDEGAAPKEDEPNKEQGNDSSSGGAENPPKEPMPGDNDTGKEKQPAGEDQEEGTEGGEKSKEGKNKPSEGKDSDSSTGGKTGNKDKADKGKSKDDKGSKEEGTGESGKENSGKDKTGKEQMSGGKEGTKEGNKENGKSKSEGSKSKEGSQSGSKEGGAEKKSNGGKEKKEGSDSSKSSSGEKGTSGKDQQGGSAKENEGASEDKSGGGAETTGSPMGNSPQSGESQSGESGEGPTTGEAAGNSKTPSGNQGENSQDATGDASGTQNNGGGGSSAQKKPAGDHDGDKFDKILEHIKNKQKPSSGEAQASESGTRNENSSVERSKNQKTDGRNLNEYQGEVPGSPMGKEAKGNPTPSTTKDVEGNAPEGSKPSNPMGAEKSETGKGKEEPMTGASKEKSGSGGKPMETPKNAGGKEASKGNTGAGEKGKTSPMGTSGQAQGGKDNPMKEKSSDGAAKDRVPEGAKANPEGNKEGGNTGAKQESTTGSGSQGDPKNAGEPKGKNADKLKNEKKGNDREGGELSGASKSPKQSNSTGGQSGEESGGGKQGGGQQANQAGKGSAGSNTSAETGAGASKEAGEGTDGNKGGDGGLSDKATGRPNESGKTGEGSKSKATDNKEGKTSSGKGSQEGAGNSGAGQEATEGAAGGKENGGSAGQMSKSPGDAAKGGTKGEQPGGPMPGEGAASSQPAGASKERGLPSGGVSAPGNTGQGGGPGETDPSEPEGAEGAVPDGDAANLEYSRKATSMALDFLKDQEHNPDPELLKSLNWTEADLKNFLRRWEELSKETEKDVTKQHELDEALRSLGLTPPKAKKRVGGNANDRQRGLGEGQMRIDPPSRYRDQFEAFRRRQSK